LILIFFTSATLLSGLNEKKKQHSNLKSFLYIYIFNAGPGAVNYIINHAEIDVVFVQDKKVKEVSSNDSLKKY